MVYRGRVKNGVVVLEEGVSLPEGAEVTVLDEPREKAGAASGLREKLLRAAGTVEGLPADASRKLDQYLYGDAGG